VLILYSETQLFELKTERRIVRLYLVKIKLMFIGS